MIRVYVELADLRAQASIKGVDLDQYTDSLLTNYIKEAQRFIEIQTGQIFEQRQLKQHFNRISGSSIQLKHFPVLPPENQPANAKFVDSLTIDNDPIGWYLTDYEHGIIFFDFQVVDWGPWRVNNVDITYTVTPDFQDNTVTVDPMAWKLCTDMVLWEIQKPADGMRVNSFSDSGFSMSFNNVDWVTQRINELKRPLFGIF